MNHVNNLNDVLASQLNEPNRGRQWIKLQRIDKRSKSAHLPIQNKQTAACENKNQTNSTATNKMGQAQSTNDLAGTEIIQISNILTPNMNLANQIGQNLLAASYLDDEFLQKIINIVKNLTKGKIKNLDSPWRERFNALSLDENNLLYIDDRLVFPKILQAQLKILYIGDIQGEITYSDQLATYGGRVSIATSLYWLKAAQTAKKQVSQ